MRVGIDTETAFLHLRQDADEVRVDVEGLTHEPQLLLRDLEGVLAKVCCLGV